MSGSAVAVTASTPPQPGTERRRLRVLYTGEDDRVWSLLEEIPFVTPERASTSADGSCPVRGPDQKLRCDAVIIDQPPGAADPLKVLTAVKSQASIVSMLVLAPPDSAEVEAAALDLGAETMPKGTSYRRRLVATLKRFHQRFELIAQHQALAAREARLRQIVETLPQGIGVMSRTFTILAVNAVALELLGASKPTDVVGRDFTSFVGAERRGEVTSALARMGQGEQTTVRCDLVGSNHDRRAVELSGVMLGRDASGGRGVLVVFREPADSGIDAVVAKLEEAERRCVELETELERKTGDLASTTHDLQTTLDATLTRLHEVEADLARRCDAESALTDTLTGERDTWEAMRQDFELRLAESETGRRDLETSLNELRADLDAERSELSLVRDRLVAERDRFAQEAEQARASHARQTDSPLADHARMMQAQRLEEVGTLAASMAPDIESQMRQVAAAAAELRGSIGPEDPRRKNVDALVGSTEDAVSVLRQLAAFSQRQTRPLETIDLNDAVRRAEPTLRHLAGSHVEFRLELGAAGSIMQTEGDLDQLLTALVVNARDMLPMGGAVTVETRAVEVEDAGSRELPADPAGVHVLAVSAQGYRSQRAQVSSSVEMLARRCGGFLCVTNDSDRSTSFKVHFPGSRGDSPKA